MATYLGILDAKNMVVKKLETIKGIGTFLRDGDGFKVTAPEGFLRRRERPESLRSSILSRIPPTLSSSSLISPLVIENAP